MNTTIQSNTTTSTKTTKRSTVARPVTPTLPAPHEADLLAKRPASEVTRLVFMALLGCAACIALVGVVSQANTADTVGTSPDDPAPAVIVELAD